MKHKYRHELIWSFLRWLVTPWLCHKFAFTPEQADIQGPYLVLANHNTDWDALLVALSFKKQMYYVASEHIFRWGFLSKVICWLLDPIPRLKGTTAADTVLTVMRRLRKGANVCIFAEGNRSWDGVTGDILPSTGKLARSCGATLVTYRLEGGYLTSPRWAGGSIRRGKMSGRVVGVYPPEQLKAMTPQEIYKTICRDLHEDAWESQKEAPVAYRHSEPAKYMERLLCVCPQCGQHGRLTSGGDTVSCACGFSVRFDEYGTFSGENIPFNNIREWALWQKERIGELARSSPDVIFSDSGLILNELTGNHGNTVIATGSLTLYPDRLECPGLTVPLESLSGIAIHGPQTIDFTAFDRHFELKSAEVYCAVKYLTAIEALSRLERAETC